MGLLEDVIGGMLGSQSVEGSVKKSPIADALTELLLPKKQAPDRDGRSIAKTQPVGGLEGLLDSFARSGQESLADSWVSTGPNRPVSPQQLEHVLDNDPIESLSRRTGLSRDELLKQLAEHLPQAVDRLTPQGRRPSPKDMGHW